jgi:hypothetical protein
VDVARGHPHVPGVVASHPLAFSIFILKNNNNNNFEVYNF